MGAKGRGVLTAAILGVLIAGGLAGPARCDEPEAPTALDLLSYAPAGTYAVMVEDTTSLRRSPVAMILLREFGMIPSEQLAELPFLSYPPGEPWAWPSRYSPPEAMASFTYSQESGGARIDAMCGIGILVDGEGWRLRHRAEEHAEPTLLRMFTLSRPPAMPHSRDMVYALVDPRTVLWGSDEEAFRTILGLHRNRGRAQIDPRLMAALAPYLNGPVFGGSLRQGAGATAEGERGPQAFAFGVLAKNPLTALVTATCGNESEARELRFQAADFLANETEVYWEREVGPQIIRSIVVSAESKTFRAELRMTLQGVQDVGANIRADELEDRIGRAAASVRLHHLWLGINMGRADIHGEYPPDLEYVVQQGYVEDNEGIHFKWAVEGLPSPATETLGETFGYVGWLPVDTPAEVIIVCSRRMVYPYHRFVLTADGKVTWLSEEKLHNPDGDARTSLPASYRLLMERLGDRFSEEDKARLRRFYEIQD